MLIIKNVRKSFVTPEGPLDVLRGIDLELAAGESLALTGESGSGKSTLLHVIAGLEPADWGEISVGGLALSGMSDKQSARLRRSHIGVVFQQFNLVPSLTVDQNIRLQARLSGRHDPAWTDRLTELLGLSDLLGRFPEQLSGGQQQRTAIARALAVKPQLVLADEPTGNLDAETGDRVMEVFLDLVRETGCALAMVTHNLRLADLMQRQAELSKGQLA